MKIYDITQELFGCVVFGGDPVPHKQVLNTISGGSPYNLTAFSMCSHNGTHIDAPYHFVDDGKRIDQLDIYSMVGYAYVAEHRGDVTADHARDILERAAAAHPDCRDRILIKGRATVTLEAAEVFAAAGVRLLGNESQTVGPEDAPMAVHLVLLGADVILLEGVRLGEVPEGAYLLSAAPLNLGGCEGAPCRAVLIEM